MSNRNDGYGSVINGLTRSMVSAVGMVGIPKRGLPVSASDIEKMEYMKLVNQFNELTYPKSAVIKGIYDSYGIDLSSSPIGDKVAVFKPSFNGDKEIRLKDGTVIKDTGKTIICDSEPSTGIQDRAFLVVSMAKAKGWSGMQINGNNDYVMAVWLQCLKQGIKVHPTPEQKALYEAFMGVQKPSTTKGQIVVHGQANTKSLKV